jgi:hypothetical protein
MGRVVSYTSMPADGFIAGPNGEPDAHEPPVEEHEMAYAFFEGADAVMFGRVGFEGFVDYWDGLDVITSNITSSLTAPKATVGRVYCAGLRARTARHADRCGAR